MFEDIYAIFQLETDGEEFDTEEDALTAANVAFREVLAERDWKFLDKSYTMPTGSLSLAGITDLDKVLDVWYDRVLLTKADRKERFDSDKDYYVDYANLLIVPVSSGSLVTSEMIIDYKMKPVDITSSNTPIAKEALHAIIARKMIMTYYRKDQDLTVYREASIKYEEGLDLLITEDGNL